MGIEIDKFKVGKYSSYKDSSIKWIGEIPKYWKSVRLASILNSVSERSGTDLPLLSITREKGVIIRDLDNEEDNHNFIPDDLSNYKVIRKGQFGMNKMKAWQGSYGISDQDGIVSPAYYIFQLRNDIDSRYFHLAIRSRLYISFFGSASDGVRIGQWDLSRDRMKNIPFLIPPLPEQTAIADFLDRKTALIDQAISIKQKQIELLKERRQILIHKAVTRGLNPNVKMKDSGVEWIGEIPEGWEVKPLKYLGYVFPGITGKRGEDFSKEYSEGMKPFIPFTNIFRYDVISNEEFQYVKIRDTEKQNNVYKNDLLFLMSSETLEDIGKCSIYLGDEKQLYLNSFCKGFRITSSNIEPTFVNELLLSDPYRSYFSVVGRGFTRMNIKQEYVNLLPILIPKLKEQNEIIIYVNIVKFKIKSAISLKEQEIEKLKEYKATLINSAVTGKLRVPSVQEIKVS
jgi:type I restriction enzyme S subunit